MATLQYANTYINGSTKLNTMYLPKSSKRDYEVYYNPNLNQYFYVDEKNQLYTITGNATKALSSNSLITVNGTNKDTLTKAGGTVDPKTLPGVGATAYIPSAPTPSNAAAKEDGTFSGTSAKPSTTTTTSNTSNKSNTSNTSSTNNSGLDYNAIYNAGYGAGTSALSSKFDELVAKLDEYMNPRVWSADELAAYYNIQDLYNKENILNKYNAATDEYYDAFINEQQDTRSNIALNNLDYYNQIINSYLQDYRYADNTLGRRSTTAANALATLLGSQDITNAVDQELLQSINASEKAREAELKNNPYLAEQEYNTIAKQLIDWGANKYESDVRNYINGLDAAAQYYAADRSYQAAQATAAANKYSGLANAAVAKAANTGTDTITLLTNMYNNALGNK